MSKHWKPDDDVARIQRTRAKGSWPQGATAGLLLVTAACIGVIALLYRIAGPRDVFTP